MREEFVYLSELRQLLPVQGEKGRRVGRLRDFTATFQQTYPQIASLVVRTSSGTGRFSIKDVEEWDFAKGQVRLSPGAKIDTSPLPENEIPLCKTFWDKQIVNLSGAKVVRVNDLQFLQKDNVFWLVHIDVGIRGLLRRLGWLRVVNAVFHWLFGRDMGDSFIAWKQAQPVTTPGMHGLRYLQIASPRLSELHPFDLAEILEDLGVDEREAMILSLDPEAAAFTLQEMPLPARLQIVERMSPETLAPILSRMHLDEAADLFARMEADRREDHLKLLPPEMAEKASYLLEKSRHGAGGLMNTQFITMGGLSTAEQALQTVKDGKIRAETTYYVYITDAEGRLEGVVSLYDLLTAPPGAMLRDLMTDQVIHVSVKDRVRDVARVFFRYNFTVVPVLDDDSRLVGIITMKDALEAEFPEMAAEAETINR